MCNVFRKNWQLRTARQHSRVTHFTPKKKGLQCRLGSVEGGVPQSRCSPDDQQDGDRCEDIPKSSQHRPKGKRLSLIQTLSEHGSSTVDSNPPRVLRPLTAVPHAATGSLDHHSRARCGTLFLGPSPQPSLQPHLQPGPQPSRRRKCQCFGSTADLKTSRTAGRLKSFLDANNNRERIWAHTATTSGSWCAVHTHHAQTQRNASGVCASTSMLTTLPEHQQPENGTGSRL